MISKKKFKKLADKHLFVLEKPKNAFGKTELEVFGKYELYKQLQLYFVSRQRELLNAYDEKMASKHMFFMPTPKESKDEFLEAFNCT